MTPRSRYCRLFPNPITLVDLVLSERRRNHFWRCQRVTIYTGEGMMTEERSDP